ncbi:MAG: YibE/F family protein [Thomasclavelia sp.]
MLKELLKSGIKIGGDMMGTMSNTLILALQVVL